MTPIGGVGINLAIQDAVAAANILAKPLLDRAVTPDASAPSRNGGYGPPALVQSAQLLLQNRVIEPALKSQDRLRPPLLIKMTRWPVFRAIPGWRFGFGIRPEHVLTPECAPS